MSKLPHILLTGFDPFGGESINPSWEAVRMLHERRIGGYRVVARLLPTAFEASRRELERAVREVEPAILLGVGQAGGRSRLSLERVAINVQDARIADNRGDQPIDEPVVAGGPAAYFSTLPIKAMLNALQQHGMPAEVSNTAGTFVCNHAFYGLMHRLATRPALARTRGGFVHLPALPEQAARVPGMPSLALATQVEALRVLLRTALTTTTDLHAQGGSLH